MTLITSPGEAVAQAGLDAETLKMTLEAIRDYVSDAIPQERQLQLDHDDVCPEDVVRGMCSDQLGVQLLFIPEEFGGMGGDTMDVYRVCEQMARLDIGIATSVLATFLGSDPIFVGATPDQKREWLTEIADKGVLYAYGATEPDAGSDLAALKTTATPVVTDGAVTGYRLNGRKQWISNGGIADKYSILASAPGGPSWFVLDRGTEGFTQNKPEDKHGIRLSNTAALFLEDALVPAGNLVGAAEGQGLIQAQQVFGYTRLMVAAFGLGGGWSALDRAIGYSTTRIQGGAPLSAKQADRRRGGRWGSAEHRGCHREVPGHRGRERGGRRRHPGPRRLWLHARVPGGEDQAGRPHHHDLRRHLRDHGDDHRARPLAAAPEVGRPVLPRGGVRAARAARAPARGRRWHRGAGQ